jgi:hypothetical protein
MLVGRKDSLLVHEKQSNGGDRLAYARVSLSLLEQLLQLPAGHHVVGVGVPTAANGLDHLRLQIAGPSLPETRLHEPFPEVRIVSGYREISTTFETVERQPDAP